MIALPSPVPPFGEKRKAAMAVYTPPFKYQHGYIFDSQHLMVADNGGINDTASVEGAVAARVRGWGRLGYLPNGAELQDEIGQMMADALNTLYATIAQPAPIAQAEPATAPQLMTICIGMHEMQVKTQPSEEVMDTEVKVPPAVSNAGKLVEEMKERVSFLHKVADSYRAFDKSEAVRMCAWLLIQIDELAAIAQPGSPAPEKDDPVAYAVSDVVIPLEPIWDDGQDRHPPGLYCVTGDELCIKEVRTEPLRYVVAHKEHSDGFIVRHDEVKFCRRVAPPATTPMPEPPKLLALSSSLRAKPTAVWRMQCPDGAYCMEWEWHEEREARKYYAEQQKSTPDYAAQYEIKRVEFLTKHQQHCNEAADLLEKLAAIEANQLSDRICDLTNRLHDANQSIANLEANLRAAISAKPAENTLLMQPMESEDGIKGWYIDGPGFYCDIDRKPGEPYSVFIHSKDGTEGFAELPAIEASQKGAV